MSARRYVRRPRVGSVIMHGTGPARVVSVSDYGRRVVVADGIGRLWDETRSDHGVWVEVSR